MKKTRERGFPTLVLSSHCLPWLSTAQMTLSRLVVTEERGVRRSEELAGGVFLLVCVVALMTRRGKRSLFIFKLVLSNFSERSALCLFVSTFRHI